MGLLFAASFGLTMWMAGSNRAPAVQFADPGATAFRAPEVAPEVADGGVATIPAAPTTSEPDPAPSLLDLAADQDPATRDEARTLLALLSAESAEP